MLLSLAAGTKTTIALPRNARIGLFVNWRSTANNTTAVRDQIKVVISDARIAVCAIGNGLVEIAISRGRMEM